MVPLAPELTFALDHADKPCFQILFLAIRPCLLAPPARWYPTGGEFARRFGVWIEVVLGHDHQASQLLPDLILTIAGQSTVGDVKALCDGQSPHRGSDTAAIYRHFWVATRGANSLEQADPLSTMVPGARTRVESGSDLQSKEVESLQKGGVPVRLDRSCQGGLAFDRSTDRGGLNSRLNYPCAYCVISEFGPGLHSKHRFHSIRPLAFGKGPPSARRMKLLRRESVSFWIFVPDISEPPPGRPISASLTYSLLFRVGVGSDEAPRGVSGVALDLEARLSTRYNLLASRPLLCEGGLADDPCPMLRPFGLHTRRLASADDKPPRQRLTHGRRAATVFIKVEDRTAVYERSILAVVAGVVTAASINVATSTIDGPARDHPIATVITCSVVTILAVGWIAKSYLSSNASRAHCD